MMGSGFNSVQQNLDQSIGTSHKAISDEAANMDPTDPEAQLKLKKDIDDYTTMMQTALGIEEAMHNLQKAIAQSIGQA